MTFKDWDALRQEVKRRDDDRDSNEARELIGRPMITGWVCTGGVSTKAYRVIFAQGFRTENDEHWEKMREFYGDRFRGEEFYFPDASCRYPSSSVYKTKDEACEHILATIEREIERVQTRLTELLDQQVEFHSFLNGGIQV